MSPEKLRATKRGAKLDRQRDEVDRLVGGVDPFLALRAAVGGGGELALGQAVHAIVLDDIDHVDAAPHGVGELAETDRGGVAVARDAKIDQVAIGEAGAGQHGGHASVHRIEAMALAEHVRRRLRGAADAAELGDAVRRQSQFETGAHNRRADRIVAAAGAKRRHRAFVVAVGEAQRVGLDGGVVEFRLGEIAHDTASRGCGAPGWQQARFDFAINEASGGRHPVEMQDRNQPARLEAEIG